MKFKSLLVALAAMTLLPLANTARAEEGLELLVPGEISVATEGTYPPFPCGPRTANSTVWKSAW